jgi:hypothetical protein
MPLPFIIAGASFAGGYLLTTETARRLGITDQKAEGLLRTQNGAPPTVSPDDTIEQWVEVTNLTPDGNGRYAGQWWLRNANANPGTWTAQGNAGDIKVVVPNSETPALSTRYRAFCSGTTSDGHLEFVALVPIAPTFTEAKATLLGDVTLGNAPSVVLSITLPLGNWMLWAKAALSMGAGTAAGDGIQLQLYESAPIAGQITNMDTYLVTQVAGGAARVGAFIMIDFLNTVAPVTLQLRAQCTGAGGNNKVLSNVSGSDTFLGYFN